MPLSKIGLIFFLPNLKSYTDRALLVSQLTRSFAQVTLIFAELDKDPNDIGLSPQLNILVIPKGKRYFARSYVEASKIVLTLLKTGKYHIVHDTFGFLLLVFMQKFRFPKVTFITSQYILAEWDLRHLLLPWYGLKMLFWKNFRQFFIRSLIHRLIFFLSDKVILQAPGLIQRYLALKLPAKKVSFLPNSCGYISAYEPRENNFSSIRLLFVGGFVNGKGFDQLLLLLSTAKKQNISITATLVGGFVPLSEQTNRAEIKRLNLQDHLNVIKSMTSEELVSAYKNHHFLFHLSRIDGSPRVVIEALSAGLPVIGSNHPGIQVLDEAKAFILFSDMNEPESLLQQILSITADPSGYENKRKKGIEHMATFFSTETVALRYQQFYQGCYESR
jgi:glycosyltransferase involved in cell wall biosynthesis